MGKTASRVFLRSAYFVVLVSAVIWAAVGQADSGSVGQVARLAGSASAVLEGETRQLAGEAEIYFQDLLKTGAESRLSIEFSDASVLTLGENASVLVDEFVYEPGASDSALTLDSLQGAFLFKGAASETAEQRSFNINTRFGTLGIRGTQVWGGPIDGSYGVLVIEGSVSVGNAAGEVMLNAGEGTMLSASDIPPTEVKQWPDEKVERAFATVAFPGE